MKTITTLTLRKKLGSILDEVTRENEEIIVARDNKPLAVLISMSEYEEKILKKNRERKLKELSAKMDRWRRGHKRYITDLDIIEIIRKIREER